MATNIKTVMTYPLNGSTRDFNIPFEYLARKFVQVTLIGRDRKPLSNIDDYRFTSKNQITTNKAWGSGDGYQLIEIRRYTSATERLVDFSDGSILRAYDLNVSQIQTLHVAEEARDLTADTIGVNNDGNLDARGRRIVNVADPVDELDAVNLKTIKEWNDGAYQSYVKAKQEAARAEGYRNDAYRYMQSAENSKNQAGVSERNAKASEVAAENSKNAASQSASSASSSASSASSSAQEAIAAKDYTKQQADRSYNEAERAKGYADSMGNAIDVGKVIHNINTSDNTVTWKGDGYFSGIGVGYPRGDAINSSLFGYAPNGSLRFYMEKTGETPKTLNVPNTSGTLATQDDVSVVIRKDTTGVSVGKKSAARVWRIADDGTIGAWNSSTSEWGFRVTTGGYVYVKSGNVRVDGVNEYTTLDLMRKSLNGGVRIMTTPSSNAEFGVIQNILNDGTQVSSLALPKEVDTIATRGWVNGRLRELGVPGA